jgi:hypothetical protein
MSKASDWGVITLFLFLWGLVIGLAYAHAINPPATVIGCQGGRCDI